MVGTGRREPFDQVQSLAVEIAGAIEPCLVGEMHDIDDERVFFPMSARVSHPEIERPLEMWSSVRVDGPIGGTVLERYRHVIRRL